MKELELQACVYSRTAPEEAQLAQLRGTALAPGEVYTGFPPKDS